MVGNEISISMWLTSQTNLGSCISEWSAYSVQMEISYNEERLSTHCKFSSWKEVLQSQSLHLFSSILAVRNKDFMNFYHSRLGKHWCHGKSQFWGKWDPTLLIPSLGSPEQMGGRLWEAVPASFNLPQDLKPRPGSWACLIKTCISSILFYLYNLMHNCKETSNVSDMQIFRLTYETT